MFERDTFQLKFCKENTKDSSTELGFNNSFRVIKKLFQCYSGPFCVRELLKILLALEGDVRSVFN